MQVHGWNLAGVVTAAFILSADAAWGFGFRMAPEKPGSGRLNTDAVNQPQGCTNFSGEWRGGCASDNKEYTAEFLAIRQDDCWRLTVEFSSGETQTIEIGGTSRFGVTTQEITPFNYDLSLVSLWNSDRTKLTIYGSHSETVFDSNFYSRSQSKDEFSLQENKLTLSTQVLSQSISEGSDPAEKVSIKVCSFQKD